VDALLPLLKEVIARRPEREAGRRLANTLAGFGLPRDDSAMTRTAAVLAGMLTKT
jgi:hypothetical protein